jgi:hydrogenase maturation protein HypF
MNTYKIHIEGLVQGVGFRPFIYHLACSLKLCGTVENRNNGVFILVNTDTKGLDIFLEKIKKECLDDMEVQDHRIGYPLINCTKCGPRFSIIKGVPYDRSMTTMAEFEMCEKCKTEYLNINDRRFHAQPVACNMCGPSYMIHYENQNDNRISQITSIASRLIEEGYVVALKGTGGYHLLCDANNEKTLKDLRISKTREGKPFAVMCRDISTVDKIAFHGNKEKELLTSWRSPVVLLESRNLLAPSVSNGLNTIGVVLPYMPFHYLLFKKLKIDTIVFTSANFSDEPVIISDKVALSSLSELANAVITYNREIFNRTDDSVCRVINGNELIIRRSRGYAPTPVKLDLQTEGIFGAGAELTNCFAIGKGKQVILSQHIGDIKNSETFDFYISSYKRFSKMFRFNPEIVVRDLHPDYLSSSFADQIGSELNIEVEQVQHHHAHIASCMAENGLDEKVIGIALDGVGLGTDSNIWGGEFMIADLCNFSREMHFEYVSISGGDKVSSEPWRSGLSYLYKYMGEHTTYLNQLKMKEVGDKSISMYIELLETETNTCLYSGAGRLFDAVAAITGICLYSSYHAEAPMLLESIIIPGISAYYDYEIHGNEISFKNTISEIISDLNNGKSAGEISTLFHNTVATAVVEAIKIISQKSGIRKVVLSGGTFQNKYLSEKIITELSYENFFVYFHSQVPPNDGGLALGQVAVAAARRV